MTTALENMLAALTQNDVDGSPLDDAVHDAASAMASSVNNGGIAEQVAFLREQGWRPSDIIKCFAPAGNDEAQQAEAVSTDDAGEGQEKSAPWYVNHYHCVDCNHEWSDEWDCQCDDECPDCGTALSPLRSEEVNRED